MADILGQALGMHMSSSRGKPHLDRCPGLHMLLNLLPVSCVPVGRQGLVDISTGRQI